MATSRRAGGRWKHAGYNEAMPPKSQNASPPETPAATLSFEKGLEQLEQIVRELERGDLALEDSIALYERGVTLTEACRQQLEEAEIRVEMLRPRGKAESADARSEKAAEVSGEESGDEEDDHEDLPF